VEREKPTGGLANGFSQAQITADYTYLKREAIRPMSFSTFKRLIVRAITGRHDHAQGSNAAPLAPRADQRPAGMQELEPRMLLSAVLTNAIPDQQVLGSGGVSVIDLYDHFANTEITGTVVRFDTVFGNIDVELFDSITPATVQNFLGYVTRQDYDGTFFHRSVENFVVQGGGFDFEAPNIYDPIFQDAPVDNEFNVSNTRGLISMAKIGSDPDSATNQWFFNLGDNSANLDNQNGGFTAFGKVLGDGMDVVDLIALTPIWDASSINSAFGAIPLRDFDNTNFPGNDNLVTVNSIREIEDLSQIGVLTYSVVSISDPLVGTSIDENGVLTITSLPTGLTGTLTVTVDATDFDGNTTQAVINIQVGAGQNSLTGNGLADLLWRNSRNGKNSLWTVVDEAVVNSELTDTLTNKFWYVAGIGDFNSDGQNDLLWRNTFTGENKVWMMNGSTFVNSVEIQTFARLNWEIGGVGDFNNDQQTDVFWHNKKNGRNRIWRMDGTALSEIDNLRKIGSSWDAAAVGDFDKDGGTDVLWRNRDNGKNKVWLLNREDGSFIRSTTLLRESNTDWVVGSVGDYNLDGNLDIVWINTDTRNTKIWEMNGTLRTNVTEPAGFTRPAKWRLAGRDSLLVSEQKALAKTQRLSRL